MSFDSRGRKKGKAGKRRKKITPGGNSWSQEKAVLTSNSQREQGKKEARGVRKVHSIPLRGLIKTVGTSWGGGGEKKQGPGGGGKGRYRVHYSLVAKS